MIRRITDKDHAQWQQQKDEFLTWQQQADESQQSKQS